MLHAFRNRPLWCLAAGLLAAGARAQSVRGPQEAEAKVDYSVARREIQSLELAINGVIASTFTGAFAQVGKTKGVYLQGYGLMFDFLVNIHRAVTSTPFGEFRDPQREITPEQKKRRIEELKEKLVRILLERGDSVRQLRRDESVTIVGFFEDRNFPGDENQNKTMVLRAFKKDLDELGRKENSWRELFRRMEIVEY
jgi:hypothetical protein